VFEKLRPPSDGTPLPPADLVTIRAHLALERAFAPPSAATDLAGASGAAEGAGAGPAGARRARRAGARGCAAGEADEGARGAQAASAGPASPRRRPSCGPSRSPRP
jgi:hypothetical protein